jgi:DNA polymerase-3 subunit epsilon
MRQVVLDTETTGLDPKLGHRVIEIAGVEMVNRRLTQRHFHRYLNPDRDIDAGAQAVHGITREFLADKPRFRDVVAEFLDFVGDAELVIHNAAFDIGFLNHELALIKQSPMTEFCTGVLDTLRMAREMFPGKRNNLDALCERLAIDNSQRNLHGALLDAELLAEVYLAMTRGQESLLMEAVAAPTTGDTTVAATRTRAPLRVLRASVEELVGHDATLDRIDKEIKGTCLWRQPAAS